MASLRGGKARHTDRGDGRAVLRAVSGTEGGEVMRFVALVLSFSVYLSFWALVLGAEWAINLVCWRVR